MTVKQKFEKIDQSKLAQAQVNILKMMADKTDNFKTKDKETLEKIDASLDKIIAKLKESNPDALKSTARKTTGKAKAKTTSASTTGGKNNVMALAKKIRKPNESWTDAQKRAKESLQGEIKQANKVVTSELQKLKAFINRRKQLKGIAGTDLLRDSKRQAKPRGQRISKDGNVYYEYRENRIDRLAPNYPKNAPLLAGGGSLNNPKKYVGKHFIVADELFYIGAFNDTNLQKSVRYLNKLGQENNIKSQKYPMFRVLIIERNNKLNFYDENQSVVETSLVYMTLDRLKNILKNTKLSSQKLPPKFAKKVQESKKYFDEFESKKFADGGGVDGIEEDIDMTDDYVLRVNKGVQPEDRASMKEWMAKTNESREAMAYKLGGTVVSDLAGHTGGSFGTGNPTLLNGNTGEYYTGLVGETGALSSGEMFEGGGNLSRDRKYVNYREDYEVRYSKGKGRHGYGNLKFDDGGGVSKSLRYEDILEVLKEKIEDSVQELPIEYEQSENFVGEEVEKNSRDGFIAYTDGGYEVRWFESVNMFNSGGYSLPTKVLDAEMQRQVDNNYQYAKERFENEYPSIVEELGEENIDYNSLYEAGYESEAEELSEFESDNDDTIMCEIGAYYYDTNNYRGIEGKHTLRLFGNVNLESPYHRQGNLDDSYDIDITFNSIKELKEKVDAGLKQILDWFDGKYYNDSKAEMKIRRMAKGGGVRKVGNRVYSLGRNWTNDHKHTNKSEKHEVNYNRKGFFATGGGVGKENKIVTIDGKKYVEVTYSKRNKDGVLEQVSEYKPYNKNKNSFADGGAVMANQQIMDDASQHYVNYYLGEGATAGMYKKGGSIPNNYAGRTPEDIWNNMDISQKLHFLSDHAEEVYGSPIVKGQTNPKMNEFFGKLIYEKYDDLPLNTKVALVMHTTRGQYAKGAIVPSKYNVSIQYPTKSSRSNWASNDNVDIKVVAKNKVEAEKKALDEFSKKFPMQKPNYVRVTKDEVSSFDNLSLKKGGMMPKVSAKKHRND